VLGSRSGITLRSQSFRKPALERAVSSFAIETLECRRLLSASLQVETADLIPGPERIVFTKIANLDEESPNTFKDEGVLRLRNVGDEPLVLSNLNIEGPYKVVGSFPDSISPGASANVTIQFTATAPPTFTYNQTNALTNQRQAGAYIGSLSFSTNDPANTTYSETLAGWFQTFSEANNEPSLQSMVNLLFDYQTNIAPPRTVTLSQDDEPVYYGEEVVSAFWQRANSSKPVGVRQIAAYHTQGVNVPVYWHAQGSTTNNLLFRHDPAASQTLLPNIQGGTGPAFGTFSTNNTFGFRVDNSYSDDSRNPRPEYGGGHEVRFFPVRDHFGNLLANTYFMVQDYSIPVNGIPPNFDFQDNLYILTNVMPASDVPLPPPTIPTVPPTVPPAVPPTVPPAVPPTVPPAVPPTVPPAVPPTVPPAVGSDGPKVSITPAALTVVEAAQGKQVVELTVTLSEPLDQKAKVRYTADSGTAIRRADFGGGTGVVKFAPGQTSRTITVKVKSDKVVEPEETFAVSLFGAKGVEIGDSAAVVTIQDGSAAGDNTVPAGTGELPSVSITASTPAIVEGASGKQVFAFDVTITGVPDRKVLVRYGTADGTATGGPDYRPRKGRLVFSDNGIVTRTINVPVKGDTEVEPDEDFVVNLLSIKNGVIATATATGTITNDDA